MLPWRCLSLALMEYRRGNYPGAIDWGNRCLAYRNSCPARTAAVRAIFAMTYHRLGQPESARSELAQSRGLIDNKFSAGLDYGDGDHGFWFDWMLGKILEREAVADIEGSPPPAK